MVVEATSTKFETLSKLILPLHPMTHTDTIIALATPAGAGAIAVLRLSGPQAVTIASEMFQSTSGKELAAQKTHTVHLGNIVAGSRVIDQVLATIFKNPNTLGGKGSKSDFIEIEGKWLLKVLRQKTPR